MMLEQHEISNWILMHKNIPVAALEIIAETGWIMNISNVFNLAHAPVGTVGKEKKDLDRSELNNWMKNRSIPASRENLDYLFEKLQVYNAVALSLKSYALSLSDQYWLRPESEDLSWGAVNFFQNDFSDDIGEFLFQNKETTADLIDINSPDNTLDGVLRKKWKIQDGRRILIKGSNDSNQQEPFNEVIASKIMTRLGIDCVDYSLTYINGRAYSVCDNFINESTELMTANRISRIMKRGFADDKFTHLLKCCDQLGMGDVQLDLEKMIVVDYLIANTDRHWGNFGFVRDVDTLKYLQFAPIYDSGTSLANKGQNAFDSGICKTFETTHNQQIKLVTDLSWYKPIPRAELLEIIENVLLKNKEMKSERIREIAKGVCERANFVNRLKSELEK